ncbi:MAG TPA: hypothetical protein VGF18_02265 [Candidatus Tumulicola sp.]|jgi:hypothetical protein
MSFIARWLDLRKQRRPVGLRPHGEIAVPVSLEVAARRVRAAVSDVLGAHVSYDDGGTIEAAFGLVQSERVRCSLSAVDAETTSVRVEAIYPPGREIPQRSNSVDAMLSALGRG